MDRRILFKGKSIDTGEWIEGSLITDVYYRREDRKSIPYILCPDKAVFDCFEDFDEFNGIYEVDEDTVCQYAGLLDRNGKNIFEGDILRHEDECVIEVIWNPERYEFAARCIKGTVLLKECKWGLWNFESDEVEIIGNVFDNPELMKGEQNAIN